MTRNERLFLLIASYGVALHTVTRNAPEWLAVCYAITLTGMLVCAIVSLHKTTDEGGS